MKTIELVSTGQNEWNIIIDNERVCERMCIDETLGAVADAMFNAGIIRYVRPPKEMNVAEFRRQHGFPWATSEASTSPTQDGEEGLWAVVRAGSDNIREWFSTREAAEKHAEMLVRQHNEEFMILHAIRSCAAKPTVLEWRRAELPF